MSWLYTLVFAGLTFSSGGDQAAVSAPVLAESPVVTERAADETERFEQTYPLTANGRVRVSNVNGSITVEAWDRNEVKLEYVKTADSRERLSYVDVKIDARPAYFSVEADFNRSWTVKGNNDWSKNGGRLSVEFKLMVPRGAVLNEIETVNGSATVSNFTNITKVSAVNGSVRATNLRGTTNLSTVNGEVLCDFERLESGSKISLNTVNGEVKLVIPSDANATVRADSLNGSITNDFGLPVRKGKYVGRDLYGRLGGGDVQIKMDSVNGGLSIGRKSDGRTLSPATNLLPQKSKDDEDWDGHDEHGTYNTSKINKEAAKAVRDSTRVAAKAAASVKVDIDDIKDIKPEMGKLVVDSTKMAADLAAQINKAMQAERVEEKIRHAQVRQSTALARMADADFFRTIPRVDKKSETFPVKGIPQVNVTGRGCSVTVRGWDKNEVQYRVTQFTDPRNRAAINMSENHTESIINIRVENPSYDMRGGNFLDESRQVRIEVFVPRKTNLKINANGEIRLDGVSGDVVLQGSDESVNVRDVDGKLTVSSSDGLVRVIGFRGELDARTSDGTINLEGDFSRLTARASDGEVTVTLPEGASADLEATCPDVAGEGISMTRIHSDEYRSRYRIGKGGSPFKIETEGTIRIRGGGALKDTF